MLTETFSLELVSPAFLAGADQTAETCELRVATLRGQLRWWWRTLHAAWLDVNALRDLEAAVWGSTEAASPVRLSLRPVRVPPAKLFNYKDGFRPKADFNGLAQPPNNKTTQGLFYLAYGMDENVKEGGRKMRKQRYYLEPGAQWELRTTIGPRRDDAAQIADQVRAAVFLLCRFGGVGSKARKAFGSFADLDGAWDLDKCKEVAKEFRIQRDLKKEKRTENQVQTPSLDYAQSLGNNITLGTTDPWTALDRLGFVVQEFAQRYAHQAEKEALGLPRRIHGPRGGGPMPGQVNWKRPQSLGSGHPYRPRDTRPDSFRHAAPVHYHLARGSNGNMAVRAIAFPSPVLPNLKTSEKLLGELLEHIKTGLVAAAGAPTASAAGAPVARGAPPRRPGFVFLRGDRVATPDGDGVVDADVRIGARRMDVDFGDGDIGSFDPARCTRLP